jgi:hypothetical protein
MSILNSIFSSQSVGIGKLSADLDDIVIGTTTANFDAGSDNNISIGKDAFGTAALDEAINNTCIGFQSGGSITTADNNTFMGYRCGDHTDDGAANTAMGKDALSNNCGDANTAMGALALTTTTGANNTAIGYGAGGFAAYSDNTAIGSGSMDDASYTGTYGVAVGRLSLSAAHTRSGTVAIGYAALKDSTTGSGNTAMGYQAMTKHSTGSNNVVIGYDAMKDTDAGSDSLVSSDNVFIGWEVAAGTWADGSSNKNVGIGYRSMYGSLNGATNNVCVGYQSGVAITSGSNNTIVGYEVDADVVGQNNQTVIGVGGVFKLLSKEYTCDHADGEDGKSAASEASPLKLPAYSIIKSVSVIIKTLSNLGTFNVALYHSTDTAAPADDTALGGTPVEVLGAGASDTCSGNSASAVDIALGSGAVVKQSYFNAYGGAGLPVGTADRYIHVGQAGTGNGDTDPGTAGVIKVLVEYVGLD